MTIEAGTTEAETTTDAPPPDIRPVKSKPDKDSKPDKGQDTAKADGDDETDGERRSRPGKKISNELRSVLVAEDATLRDIVGAIGTEGSYRIRVSRIEPEQFRDPITNQMVNVSGFLKNYHTPVDEEILQKNHGGGKFQVQFFRKNATGGYVHFTQRTIPVVGDPRTDDTFRQMAPAQQPAPAPAPVGESSQLVGKMFDIMSSQLDKKDERERAPVQPHGPDPGMQQVIKLLQDQIAESNRQLSEMRKELSEARNVKPAEDPFKEMMLKNLFENDSARLLALKSQYESEIRILKENHRDDEKRMRDAFERDRSELKQMHMNEVTLLRQSHEVQLTAARGSYDTNMKMAEHENKRVERENAELKSDNKDLRAKKEKGPLEIVKEAEQIKEALGGGEGEDKSGWEKAAELAPGLIEAAKGYFKPPEPPQQQQQLSTSRKMVQTPDGQKWILDASGKLTPVKKKPPPPPQPGPNGEPPIPVIAPEMISQMITYLERAFAGNQDPDIVAQSGRSAVPDEILAAIRDHGVDGFLTKVAKLPSTSPLANQAGRNWVRRVGKALVGE